MATGQDMTIANSLLKSVYLDGINEQINSETPALGQIKSTADNITSVGGGGVIFSIHIGRNSGIGARGERELLPTAGAQQYARGTSGLKNLYGTVEVTGQVMNQAKGNTASFVNVVDEEVRRIKDDLAKDQNRQVYGDGTGTLCSVITAATSATQAVDDARYIGVGETVDVLQFSTLSAGSPTKRNPTAGLSLTVVTVDSVANTVTFDQSITTTVGDVLVRSQGSVNSWKKEWTGFGAIISNTGTLFGIDPTVVPDWKAVVQASGGSLTEPKMNAVVQAIRQKGSKPTRILTTPGCYNAYWATLQSMRQYVNKEDLTGGIAGLAFNTPYGNIPLLTDFDAPKGTMYFPNEDELQINTNVGWEFIDEGGSMWQKKAGYDGFVAELRNYSELTTHRRNAHGKLTGINEV